MFLLLLACTPDTSGPSAWAVDYFSLRPGPDGVEGHRVWSFYAEGWERELDPAFFQCSMIQTVTGTVRAGLEGCVRCEATYALELALLETDCGDGREEDERWYGLRALGVGDVDPGLVDRDPFVGESRGFYTSYDGQVAEGQGWAFPEELGWGAEPATGAWGEGQGFTLWPAYAWAL